MDDGVKNIVESWERQCFTLMAIVNHVSKDGCMLFCNVTLPLSHQEEKTILPFLEYGLSRCLFLTNEMEQE